MSSKKYFNTLSMVGTAFVVTLAASNVVTAQEAGANPFAMNEMSGGYTQVAKEGKCGEGKCGGSMTKDTSEGKCGAGMKKESSEGKCGEGKCGGSMNKDSSEGKCGAGMKKDSSEGKCGSGMKEEKKSKCGGM